MLVLANEVSALPAASLVDYRDSCPAVPGSWFWVFQRYVHVTCAASNATDAGYQRGRRALRNLPEGEPGHADRMNLLISQLTYGRGARILLRGWRRQFQANVAGQKFTYAPKA